MHKSIKLNYFEHSNTFESCNNNNNNLFYASVIVYIHHSVCKQAGVDNRSSQFILEMVCFLERKIEVFFFANIFPMFDKHTL